MRRGLDWYKRESRSFLDGVRAAYLSAKEIAVYTVVLDLIYEGGGQTPNQPSYISGYIQDMGAAGVRNAISSLLEKGKLIENEGNLTQKRAQNEAKTKRKLSETRSISGHIGGVSSAKSRAKTAQNNDLDEANASSKTQAEKRREEKRREEKKSPSDSLEWEFGPADQTPAPKKKSKKKSQSKGSRIPENWTLTDDLFEYAREKGMNDDAIRTEEEKFYNYWIAANGANAVKRSWDATWKGWVLREVERNGGGNGKGNGHTRSSSPHDGLAAAAQELASEYRDRDRREGRSPYGDAP